MLHLTSKAFYFSSRGLFAFFAFLSFCAIPFNLLADPAPTNESSVTEINTHSFETQKSLSPYHSHSYFQECLHFARQNLSIAAARGCMVGAGAALVVIVERSVSHDSTVSEHIQNAVLDLHRGESMHALRQLGVPEAIVYGSASSAFQIFGKPYGDLISTATLTKKLPIPKIFGSAVDFSEKIARSYGVEFSYILITSGLTLWMSASGDVWKVAQLTTHYVTYATAFWAMVEQGWFDQSIAEQKNRAIATYPHLKTKIESFFGNSTAAFAVGSTVALIAHVFGQTLSESPELKIYFSMPMNLFISASIANLSYLYLVQKNIFRVFSPRHSPHDKNEDTHHSPPKKEPQNNCPGVFGAIWGLRPWRT